MKPETVIELKAVGRAAALGWIGLKVQWTHYPDRIFIGQKGAVVFIEFKTPEGELRPGQRSVIRDLIKRDIPVYICSSADEALRALSLHE